MSTLLSLIKSFLSLLLVLFRYLFYRAISSFLTGIVLLFVAVLMFVTFHQAYMPVVSHVKPVYLQFSSECQDTSAGLCSYPEASVFFTSKNKANDERMLMRGQSYKVFLHIEMPSSPTNEKLGMFMVNLKFLSAKGTVLKSSSRSCMLHYESSLVRLFRTMFYSLPLTLGLTEEKQKVKINFFEDYIDDSYHPAVQAKVVIMTRQVEIYSSTLQLQASFTGLRYLIFNWPILFSCLAVLGNFITITLIYSACINQFYSSSSTAAGNSPQQATEVVVRNTSLEQNGTIANSSATRATTLTNHNRPEICVQQSSTPLPQQNETSDNPTPSSSVQLLGSQAPKQTLPVRRITTACTLCKPRKHQTNRASLSQIKLSRKLLKIKNHKTGNLNQREENICNEVEESMDNVQCTSQDITEIHGANYNKKSDFIKTSPINKFNNTAKVHKPSNKNGSTSHYEKQNGYKRESNKHCEKEITDITGMKNSHKKALPGNSKKCNEKKKFKQSSAVDTKLDYSSISSMSAPEFPVGEQPVLTSYYFTRKWGALRFPRIRRMGRYLEENIPVFTKRVRHCISDLELSSFEENRLHVIPGNSRKYASTSDLTLIGQTEFCPN